MEQSTENVTFKMRKGKKLQFCFGALCMILLSTHGASRLFNANSEETTNSLLLLSISLVILLFPAIIIIVCVFRLRLEFSNRGLFYQGPISKFEAIWDEVKGWVYINHDLWLKVEKQIGGKTVKYHIPFSWFSIIPLGYQSFQSDKVFDSLVAFAPHLVDVNPHTRGPA